MTLKLRLQHGEDVREFEFDRDEVRLGRGPSNDLVIEDVRLSRMQGRFHRDEEAAHFSFEGGCSTRHVRGDQVLDRSDGDERRSWMLQAGDRIEIAGDLPIVLELREVSKPRGPHIERLKVSAAEAAPVASWLDQVSDRPDVPCLVETLRTTLEGEPVRVIASLHTPDDEYLNDVVAGRADDHEQAGFYADPLRILGPIGARLVEWWAEEHFVAMTSSRGGHTWLLAPVRWGSELHGVVALDWDVELDAERATEVAELLCAFEPVARLVFRSESAMRNVRSLAEENRYFRERERRHYEFKDLICESDSMREVFGRLNALVDESAPVLIVGEAGTGKELLARALHHLGEWRDGMMITLNCGQLPEETLDYELFGSAESHMEGAFAARKGVFELASGGTVFLEEVDCLTPLTQGKIVRMLKEGEVRRVGDAVGRTVRARVVASIHRDLNDLVQSGQLRRDLYLLLKQNILSVPPLRERRADILPLARTFLRTYGERYDGGPLRLSDEASEALLEHDWPGNVRELQTRIEAAVLDAKQDEMTRTHLGL